MKTKIYHLIFFFIVAGAILSSCVSSKKYNTSQAQVDKLQREKNLSQSELSDCNIMLNETLTEKLSLQAKYDSVQSEIISLNKFSTSVIDEQAKRLRALNNLVYTQKEVLNELRNSISNALTSYNADELKIYIKDGNIYISLSEKLLFESGSDVVDPKGKEALKALSIVLGKTSGFTVMVEGHTDNVPVSTNQHKDNWALSVARATSVVRIISNDFGFNPNRITASGKGKFQPLQTNETEEGRAANRRTEIILTPNLEDFYKVLYQ